MLAWDVDPIRVDCTEDQGNEENIAIAEGVEHLSEEVHREDDHKAEKQH